nr:histone-lysine N-methyltransferase SETMAR-like [Macaca fascicularis]
MEMMLDKKQNQAIFLFEFKMGNKATETTCNIDNVFGPRTADKCTVRWWFKKFCKGDKSLDHKEYCDQPLEADHDQLRAIIEADPFTTIGEVAGELSVNHSMVIWHSKQIGKRKKLDKWVPHELSKEKSHHFEVSSLILCNNKPFLGLDCDVQRKEDFIQLSVITSSVVGPRRSSKALLKDKLASKKKKKKKRNGSGNHQHPLVVLSSFQDEVHFSLHGTLST